MLRCFSYCTILLNCAWQLSQMNPSNDWFSHSLLIRLKLGLVFSWILAGFSAGWESEENCVSGWDVLVESRLRSEALSVEGVGVGGCWRSSGRHTFLCRMYSIRLEAPAPQCSQLKLSKREPNLLGLVFSFSSCLLSSPPGLGSESLLVLVLLSDLSLSAFSFLLVLGVLCLAGADWGVQSRLLMPNSARWAILHWSNCNVLPWNTQSVSVGHHDISGTTPWPRACEWAGCSRLSKPCTSEIWCESWEHHRADLRRAR